MGVIRSIVGIVHVELTSADVPGMLTAIHRENIEVLHIHHVNDLTVTMVIGRQHFRRLRALLDRRGETIVIVRRRGLYWTGKRLLKRPVLLVGIAIFGALMCYLPSRIFFVRVEGNKSVPSRLILEQAENCGISIFASRRGVRSEKVKNDLLNAIPELQWAAVNTSGCVATITVRERTATAKPEESSGVSSIVAARDGVITECTVTKGNPLCKIGQAVKAGEVLVSGYTDCGLHIRATKATGEVFAQTQREISVILPLDFTRRGTVSRVEKKYALVFGKKRINFYKDSGISDTSCDKMYAQYILTLPGGFALPLAVTVETLTYYDDAALPTDHDALLVDMERYAEQYVLEQMISGVILQRDQTVAADENICTLHEVYTCQEMIGRVRNEEMIGSHGEDN